MSAALCTVCLDTGSKSRDLNGDLDCYECSASDERIKFRSTMRTLGNKNGGGTSIDGMNWRAYQMGKASATDIGRDAEHYKTCEGYIAEIAYYRRDRDEWEAKFRKAEAANIAAAPVVPVAAQPVVPGLEFVQAIANNFDSHDRETDEVICRGCSAPELWIEETQSYLITHRPECIVLRARAFLAAPQPAASVTDVAKDAASWMPIQTAPKDGTRFLAVHEGKVGFWHWQGEPNAIVGWRDSFIYVFRDGDGPTHWMKLPEIPAAIAAQQGEKT